MPCKVVEEEYLFEELSLMASQTRFSRISAERAMELIRKISIAPRIKNDEFIVKTEARYP